MPIPLFVAAAAGVAAIAAAMRKDRQMPAEPPGQIVASGMVVSRGEETSGTTMDVDDVLVKVDSTPSDESITDRSPDEVDHPVDFDPDDLDLVTVVESPKGRNMVGEQSLPTEFGADPVAIGPSLTIIGARGATGEIWTILDSDWSGVGYDYLVSGLSGNESSVWITSVELREMIQRSQKNGIRFEINVPPIQFDPAAQSTQ